MLGNLQFQFVLLSKHRGVEEVLFNLWWKYAKQSENRSKQKEDMAGVILILKYFLCSQITECHLSLIQASLSG